MDRLEENIQTYLKSESLENSTRCYLLLKWDNNSPYYKALYVGNNDFDFMFEIEGHIHDFKFHIVPDWDFNVDSYLLNDLENGYRIIDMPLKSHSDHWFAINIIKDDIEHQNGLQEYLKYCDRQGVNIDKLKEYDLVDEDISVLYKKDEKWLKEKFEPIKLFGEFVLFTPSKIRNDELPKNIYRYEVRHDDECRGEMVELGYGIMVNHWGTILSSKPIELEDDSYRFIDEDKDVKYLDHKSITLMEYLNSQKKKKDMER